MEQIRVVVLLLFLVDLRAKENVIQPIPAGQIYRQNCLQCHQKLSFNLKQVYFDYLLKYSSEKAVKLALIDYLKSPNKDTSVMSKEYIRRFGVKKPTSLTDEELEKAIDYYWKRYTVFGKLK